MKILVPTDFSKLSKVAIRYAAALGREIGVKITLINVAYLEGPPQTTIKNLNAVLYSRASEDMSALIEEMQQEGLGEWIQGGRVMNGFPVEDSVNNYALEHDVDLIIMGTKGAGGLKKVLLGSNAAAMINRTRIPVLAVPAYARYRGINNLVYATDMTALEEEVRTIGAFAQLLGAQIHVLHTVSEEMEHPYDTQAVLAGLKTAANYDQIQFSVVVNPDITDGICEYMADVQGDLLAMFTHQVSIFEKLMGSSITREMAFHSWVPVLAIKK